MKISVVCALLVTGLFLAGCEKPEPELVGASQTYYASKVKVASTAEFAAGLSGLYQGETEQVVENFDKEIHSNLKPDMQRIMHGKEAAEVILQLESSSVTRSAVSVIPNIAVDGTLFIKEARSGNTVVAIKVHAAREEAASYTPSIQWMTMAGLCHPGHLFTTMPTAPMCPGAGMGVLRTHN